MSGLLLASSVAAQPLRQDISSYFLLGLRTARLKNMRVLDACNAGVDCDTAADSAVCGSLSGEEVFFADGSQVAAASASFTTPGASVWQLFRNGGGSLANVVVRDPPPMTFTPPLIPGTCDPGCAPDVGALEGLCGFPNPFSACDPSRNLVVQANRDCAGDTAPGNGDCDLPPGVYGKVAVRAGATLNLTTGDYVFCGLAVGRGGTVNGHGTRVELVGTTASARTSLRSTNETRIGGQCDDLTFLVKGKGTVSFGRRAKITARVCGPAALLRLGHSNLLVGAFIGDTIFADRDDVAHCCPGAFVPVCGDSTVQFPETCDPPGATVGPAGNVCRANCTYCGDGITDSGEQCDDGNGVNGDGCDNDCMPSCGNGVVDPANHETCDPPGTAEPPNGNTCRAACTFCGDANQDPEEECDDGNSDDLDGCDNGCKLTAASVDLVIHKPPVIDTAEPEIPEANEETVGAQTWVNLDNDDKDGKFDIDDDDVTGENEMVKLDLKLRPNNLKAGTVKLEATQGGTTIRVWEKANKMTERTLPATLNVPADFTVEGNFLVRHFWVEGITAHTAQRQVLLKMTYTQGATSFADTVALTVLGFQSIEWVGQGNSLNDDNTLDADPNFPSGLGVTAQRVFTDARVTGTPAALEANARDKVTGKITLTVKPIEAVNAYFRAFDVDDPTSAAKPVDDETMDEDNRGTTPARVGKFTGEAAGVLTKSFTNQTETIEFQTTTQPGDNFRIVGNGDKVFLATLENKDSAAGATNADKQRIVDHNVTGTLAQREIKQPDKYASPTLTVWRFMHVEVDSMTAPPAPPSVQANVVDVAIKSITDGVPPAGGGRVAQQIFTTPNVVANVDTDGDGTVDTADASPRLPAAGRRGRFQNGSVEIGGPPGTVTNGIDGNGLDFVQRNAGITIPFVVHKVPLVDATGNVRALGGTTFTLTVTGGTLQAGHNGGTLSVAGVNMNITGVNVPASQVTVNVVVAVPVRVHDDDSDTVLPHTADTAFMQASDDQTKNLYAKAFIRPRYDEGGKAGSNQQTVPFVINTESPKVYAKTWQSRPNNADRFWVVYVLSAFQDSFRNLTADRDDDTESGTGGSTSTDGGSLIYLEVIRERGPAAAGMAAGLERRVVAHEVGHAMRLDHPKAGTCVAGGVGADDDDAKNGLMNTSNQNGPTGGNLRIIDCQLDLLRRLGRPKS